VTKPLRGMIRDMDKLAAGGFALVLPGLGRSDEIGAMAEAVEQFKMTTMERAGREVEQQETGRRAAAAQRQLTLHKLADGFEAAVGDMVTAVTTLSQELEDSTRELSIAVGEASSEASLNVKSVAQATQELTTSVSEISERGQE
jgi:hypothetical protein